MDLDVCGEASLFRLLTTPTVPPGHATIRDWLLAPAAPEEIRRRQEAVAELAPQVDLRQTLEAAGRLLDSPDPESIEAFLDWAEEEPWLPEHRGVVLGARILPLLTGALAALQLWGPVRGPWWVFSLVATFALASAHRGRIHALMEAASGGQERFGRYAALLTLLMEMDVEAPALREVQEKVRSSPVGAPRELLRLGRRVGWADIRFSGMAHAPLQALLAWDVHLLTLLEGWKRRSGPHVREWLAALGRLEALLALAALKADHPEWCFPSFVEGEEPHVRARGLGHPLLPPSSCVANDVEVGPPGTFLFVTGSNMSGKSTLLRAVGINAVLAQTGGPVCALEMEMTPAAVLTSMRTTDSLAQGVSQYMAELKRIQQVVEGARRGREVIYLLDEPLQGTNEAERRVAVQTILGHLLEAGAIGAVATHDLQLDGIPKLSGAARAVHLEGQVQEGDGGPILSFDYSLRSGRATSTNALALLRAVGLGENPKDG
jgi:DNA mismatch repair ATPase MutS